MAPLTDSLIANGNEAKSHQGQTFLKNEECTPRKYPHDGGTARCCMGASSLYDRTSHPCGRGISPACANAGQHRWMRARSLMLNIGEALPFAAHRLFPRGHSSVEGLRDGRRDHREDALRLGQ